MKLPHFIKKINISNWFWQFLISSIPTFFCWFLKIWTHSSSFEYWNNLIERTRLQKNSEIIALEFHAVMKICIRAIHVNIFFRFTTLQIKVGEKREKKFWWPYLLICWLISCFFIIQSSKSRLNSEKICFSRFLSFIYILNSADLVMSERIEKLRIFSAFSKSVFGTSNIESVYFEIRKQLFKNWFEYEW